jgi:hypothetical protein
LSEKHGTHETLLKAFWEKIGFVPGDFMSVGMASKRFERLRRYYIASNGGDLGR